LTLKNSNELETMYGKWKQYFEKEVGTKLTDDDHNRLRQARPIGWEDSRTIWHREGSGGEID
jgi:hypothetical protein